MLSTDTYAGSDLKNHTNVAPPSPQELDDQALSSRGTSLDNVIKSQKKFFNDRKTRSFEFRDRQLRILKEAIQEHEEKILEATIKDLGKPYFEAFGTEAGFIYTEIAHTRAHLSKWMKPQKVRSNVLIAPAKSQLIHEPLGQVLIISPWNYPFQLLMGPLIGAIAAGNCAVVKPSEMTPHTSKVIADLLNETFPEEYIAVFEGGPSVSQSLLNNPWDHIFFTGSTKVGKIIAKAAAKHLTPVTLELGGKSPCIVDPSANLKLTARRIVWGKYFNAGQTCVAPDYLLVHKDIKDKLIKLIEQQIKHYFGNDPHKSKDFGRIVSKGHCERLAGFLENGRVICGGIAKIEERYIAPTVIENVDFSSDIMKEEIFGPILPVITYEHLDSTIEKIKSMDKPLAVYVFSKSQKTIERIKAEISFGGGCVNDTLMHFLNPEMPFGGVGASGMGGYHGKYSFETFSHRKSILQQNSWFDMPVRYPPYRNWKLKVFRFLMGS